MNLNFNDLIDLIVNEAPMSSYLSRPTSQEKRNQISRRHKEIQAQAQADDSTAQQQPSQPSFTSRLGKAVKAAAPGVGRGAWELTKGVGGVVGTAAKNVAKTALNAPGAVKTARNFLIGDDPAGMLKQGISNLKAKQEQDKAKREAENSKIEEFDKDTIKSLLASQTAASQNQPVIAQQQPQTQTGAVQAPGTVSGGNVQRQSSSGTTATTMQPTITPSSQSNLLKRDPKSGDIFTIPDDFGRIRRYKVKKVVDNSVQAVPITTSK